MPEEILNLIESKKEGPYWDFKKQWYGTDNKGKQDLLHDIICFSNNSYNRDAYIIVGIDEEKDFKINDITNDPNRKNTQKIIDFLKNKKFAGDFRPTIYVNNYCYDRITLDVIVIKNSNNTPFYLDKSFQGVRAYHIYSRIQDTNTPIDSSADINIIEWLWKKRLGLVQLPLERLELYLEYYKDWENSPYGETHKYYKYLPEFTIEYDDVEESRDGYEYYLFNQMDSTPHWRYLRLKYNGTLLKELVGISLDGGRYFSPCPDIDFIQLDYKLYNSLSYRSFTKNTLNYKLNEFFYYNELELCDESRYSRKKLFECILLFENENEKAYFESYVSKNRINKDKYLEQVKGKVPHIPQFENLKKDAYIEPYQNALIFQLMLEECRNKNLNVLKGNMENE